MSMGCNQGVVEVTVVLGDEAEAMAMGSGSTADSDPQVGRLVMGDRYTRVRNSSTWLQGPA